MAKQQKPENKKTTISVVKSDKNILRKLAKEDGITNNGIRYESDTKVVTRILAEYLGLKGIDVTDYKISSTYPQKP